jgi:hypothetical protein
MERNWVLQRDTFGEDFTLGILFDENGKRLADVCEDLDRKLESGGVKVKGKTAIPRGRYKLEMQYSSRFKRELPEFLDVPGFSEVKFHGGNTSEDTEGCPLVGAKRKPNGVSNCAGVLNQIIALCLAAESIGDVIFVEVS